MLIQRAETAATAVELAEFTLPADPRVCPINLSTLMKSGDRIRRQTASPPAPVGSSSYRNKAPLTLLLHGAVVGHQWCLNFCVSVTQFVVGKLFLLAEQTKQLPVNEIFGRQKTHRSELSNTFQMQSPGFAVASQVRITTCDSQSVHTNFLKLPKRSSQTAQFSCLLILKFKSFKTWKCRRNSTNNWKDQTKKREIDCFRAFNLSRDRSKVKVELYLFADEDNGFWIHKKAIWRSN